MFDQITLPNGLRVVGEKLTHVRSCTVGVWVKVGSMNEKPEENGMSHFIEHMVFKGTQTRSARDIAEEMDMVGGQLNAFTSKECTCYYAKVTDDELALAVDILADLALRPVFDEKELNKERGVVLEEISMVEDTPEDLVHELLSDAQYNGSLRFPILGPARSIRQYSREDMVRYWEKHYVPENMATMTGTSCSSWWTNTSIPSPTSARRTKRPSCPSTSSAAARRATRTPSSCTSAWGIPAWRATTTISTRSASSTTPWAAA